MHVAAFLRSYGALYAIALVVGMYSAIYATARLPISPVVQIVFSCGTATCLAMWACLDARSRRCTPCFDFGTFVFFTWYITVPCYLIATRGWPGLLIAFTTVFTMFVAALGVVIVFVLAGLVA